MHGQYWIRRGWGKTWDVVFGLNGVVEELGLPKRSATALCNRLNDKLWDQRKSN